MMLAFFSTLLYLLSLAALVTVAVMVLDRSPEWATFWLVTAIYSRHRAEELRSRWQAEKESDA